MFSAWNKPRPPRLSSDSSQLSPINRKYPSGINFWTAYPVSDRLKFPEFYGARRRAASQYTDDKYADDRDGLPFQNLRFPPVQQNAVDNQAAVLHGNPVTGERRITRLT